MFSKDGGVVTGRHWAKNRPTTVCLTPSSISSTPPAEMILFFSTPVILTTLFLPFRGELVPGTQPVCGQTAVKEFLFQSGTFRCAAAHKQASLECIMLANQANKQDNGVE